MATSGIRRVVGVYDADHTLLGEAAYWVGARLGRRHCALCDITHGLFTAKREWTDCRSRLPYVFDTYHRDDQPGEVRAALMGRAPAVAAEMDDGSVVPLLHGDELEACEGDVQRLLAAVDAALARLSG
ncbi:MAG: hypothetical protein KGR47_00480 [Acidobacteria bacterium]|nr:hypothetical protein [Acidobacteriota bacterium]